MVDLANLQAVVGVDFRQSSLPLEISLLDEISMCATCVYLNFDNGPICVDEYFARLSKAFDVVRLKHKAFRIHWANNEQMDFAYDDELDEETPMIVLGDQFNDSTNRQPRYIRPDQLVPLIDWHVQEYSVDPDHVLGNSNHFYNEFKETYLQKPIMYSHFKPRPRAQVDTDA